MGQVNALPRIVAVGGVLAGATAFALLPVSAASGDTRGEAPTSCEVHELPMPPDTEKGLTEVTGSSPDGRTLLGTVPSSGGDGVTVVIWRDGKIVETIDNAPGPLYDMNSNGEAVGNYDDQEGHSRSWIYADGKIHELAGKDVTAEAINDSGQIVGSRMADTGDTPDVSVPVTWPSGADSPVDLLPDMRMGHARDVTNDGTIIGDVAGETGYFDGFVWRTDGTFGPLPRPEGTPAEESLTAEKISGPWVVGSGPAGAIRWNLETDTTETVNDVGVTYRSAGINERGWIVGVRHADSQPVLAADGKVIPLPRINDAFLHSPRSISADAGVIGGFAWQPAGPIVKKALYWTCS